VFIYSFFVSLLSCCRKARRELLLQQESKPKKT